MAEPGRRVPADRLTVELAIGDVERAVDEQREAQARPGAELEHAHAALDAVAEGHKPDAGDLRQRAHPLGYVSPREAAAIELNHGRPRREPDGG